MADYRVRFQIQGGRGVEESSVYSDYKPCSIQSAISKLDDLERDARKVFRHDSTWERAVSSEINRAKDWVRNAEGSGISASGLGRSQYNHGFNYDGDSYRCEIEINGGQDHFKSRY